MWRADNVKATDEIRLFGLIELREHHMGAKVQAVLVLPSSEFRVLESRQLYPRHASLTSRYLHLAALHTATCSVDNHPSKSANNQQKALVYAYSNRRYRHPRHPYQL